MNTGSDRSQLGSRSWGSLLRTARAPLAVLIIGLIGLGVPSQTHDMLVYLGAFGWGTVAFHLALIALSLSAWYWSRAALAARFGIGDSQRERTPDLSGQPRLDVDAYQWLPRCLFLVGAAAGLFLLALNGEWWNAAIVAAWAAVLLVALVWRSGWRGGRTVHVPPQWVRNEGFRAWLRGGAWLRLKALLYRAPYGPTISGPVLAVCLLLFFAGALESFIVIPDTWPGIAGLAARVFPGPSIAVFGLALIIGPLATLTFVFDGLNVAFTPFGPHRPPVIIALLAYVFVVVPNVADIHTVRVEPPHFPLANRARLQDIFASWATACYGDHHAAVLRPVIVAVSGGATRAGLWGAVVLDQVEKARQPGGPALFAVSSVSGGSLGVAAIMTLLSANQNPCKPQEFTSVRPASDGTVPLAGDALGPLLGGWLFGDIPRAFFAPLASAVRALEGRRPNGGDSAEAIERAFGTLWSNRPAGVTGFAAPFLSLFYQDGGYRAGMPVWLANGTDATTGNRVITAPISSGNHDWPFRSARDALGLLGGDVRIETAINNTARFPYLEPFGQLLPLSATGRSGKTVGALIDGGYFDNEGLQTALELAERLRALPNLVVRPIIVQATGDGSFLDPNEVVRCGTRDDPLMPGKDSGGLWQLLAPIAGLYDVRGGHTAVLLRESVDALCSDNSFVHFYLGQIGGRDVPLNWVLSGTVAKGIWTSALNEEGNSEQVSLLKEIMKGDR